MSFCRKRTFALILIYIILCVVTYMYILNLYNVSNDEMEPVSFSYRNRHLNVQCYNHKNNGTKVSIFKHVIRKMFIDNTFNISWCPVYQTGSSIWLDGFAKLSGLANASKSKYADYIAGRVVMHSNLNKKFKRFNETKSFLFVRHPFERVFTMYREIRDYTKFHFKQEPNFSDVLRNLITNHSLFALPWRSIFKQCLPCTLDYDYIIRMEYFQEDVTKMLRELHLKDKFENIDFEIPQKHELVIKDYFKTVSCDLLHKLYEFYKDDFIYFDYSPEEYYSLTKC